MIDGSNGSGAQNPSQQLLQLSRNINARDQRTAFRNLPKVPHSTTIIILKLPRNINARDQRTAFRNLPRVPRTSFYYYSYPLTYPARRRLQPAPKASE